MAGRGVLDAAMPAPMPGCISRKGAITVLEGIRARAAGATVSYAKGASYRFEDAGKTDGFTEALGVARDADVVIAVMGDVFKRLRMSMLLIQDAVEREHMLTAQQRDKVSSLIDGALNDMADDLVEQFKEPEGEDDEL